MEHSRRDVGKTSLDEYVSVVASLYSTHDSNRSVWDVWCHTLHHAAGVAEQIRKRARDEKLHREIADFSLWLFTMVLKLKGEFGSSQGSSEAPTDRFIRIQSGCSDMLWHRYPNICPSCYTRRLVEDRAGDAKPGQIGPCDCLEYPPGPDDSESKRMQLSALQRYSFEIQAEKPTAVDEWQNMFSTVFRKNLATFSLKDIALHLMEELGEASDAMIRMYSYKRENFLDGEPYRRQSNLEAQLADVFSWLFALVGKLDSLKENELKRKGPRSDGSSKPSQPVRLSEIIWDRYGSEEKHSFYCQSCKGAVCTCPIILVPATRPGAELMEKFK